MEMIYLIRPEHLNGAGRLFGGKLVEWMDELSALVAIRHGRRDVTTGAIDNRKNHSCGPNFHGGSCRCLY